MPMNRLRLAALLLWLPCMAAWSQTVDSADHDAYRGASFKRTALMVADLDRALRLYRDVLGLTVDEITQSSGDSFGYATFKVPAAAGFRFAALSAGSQVRTLGLAEVTGVELPDPPLPHAAAVVFRVLDMAKTVQQIKDLDLELGPSNKAVTSDGTDFIEQPLVDFDGHLVVLYQLMPGE
jgi:catechol 2,3-dioxygenase-like lactoylglutathione lyase family enzyme